MSPFSRERFPQFKLLLVLTHEAGVNVKSASWQNCLVSLVFDINDWFCLDFMIPIQSNWLMIQQRPVLMTITQNVLFFDLFNCQNECFPPKMPNGKANALYYVQKINRKINGIFVTFYGKFLFVSRLTSRSALLIDASKCYIWLSLCAWH